MTEQRFSEDEAREIFGRAAKAPASQTASASARPDATTGLTLAEMQDIGREAGLDPNAIARAADEFATRIPEAPEPQHALGIPMEVRRTVDLRRAPTDAEWDTIVSDLRNTFGATGRITTHGEFREWRNGNLRVAVEPAGNGYRLRLQTRKGNARMLYALGGAGLLTATLAAMTAIFSGGFDPNTPTVLMIGGSSAGVLIGNTLRLRDWGRRRAEQMESLASRIRSALR